MNRAPASAGESFLLRHTTPCAILSLEMFNLTNIERLKMPGKPKYDVKNILDLYRQGLSTYQVAKEIGATRSAVERYVRAAGLSRRRFKSHTIIDENGVTQKYCTACQAYKPATKEFFDIHKSGYGGLASQCKSCRDIKYERYRNENPDITTVRWRKWRNRLRREAIIHYSNGANCCACCGEKHYEFLTIDHVDGNGKAHRRQNKVSGGSSFYRWLKLNDYPLGFRILCYNCNCSFGAYGYCPHNQN